MGPNKIKSAVIGGLIVGLLSAIPFVNYCCCIWTLGGGFLAVFLLNKDGGSRGVAMGDGATVGAMAGAIGAVIYTVIAIPLGLLLGAAQMEEAFKQAGIAMPLGGVALVIIGTLVAAICLLALTVVGGVIGALVYKPKGGPGGMPQSPYGPTPGNPNAAPY